MVDFVGNEHGAIAFELQLVYSGRMHGNSCVHRYDLRRGRKADSEWQFAKLQGEAEDVDELNLRDPGV